MNPAALLAILSLVQEAVVVAPAFAADLQHIFAGGVPTAEDFSALRAKVAGETYSQFVPASSLPPAFPAQQAPN